MPRTVKTGSDTGSDTGSSIEMVSTLSTPCHTPRSSVVNTHAQPPADAPLGQTPEVGACDTEISDGPDNKINLNWHAFKAGLTTALNLYCNRGMGGAEGKFRAARLRESLGTIILTDVPGITPARHSATHTQQKELILLACTVVLGSSSQELRTLILNNTGYTAEHFQQFQQHYVITENDLSAKNTALLTPVDTASLIENPDACAAKIKTAINDYQGSRTPRCLLTDPDSGICRAYYLQQALDAVSSVTPTIEKARMLLELMFLLTKTTSTQLTDTVLAAVGVTREIIENLPTTKRALCADFYQLDRSQADQVFPTHSLENHDNSIVQQLRIASLPVGQATQQVAVAHESYLSFPGVDALGRARCNNFMQAVTSLSQGARNQEAVLTADQQKEYVLLLCALVFYAGSTDFKNQVLTQCNLTEDDLKRLRQHFSLSPYVAWKKARTLNVLSPWNDRLSAEKLTQYLNLFLKAGIGEPIERIIARNCVVILSRIPEQLNHEHRYLLVRMAGTLVFCNATILQRVVITCLTQGNLHERDVATIKEALKNQCEQFGVTRGTLEAHRILDSILDDYYQALKTRDYRINQASSIAPASAAATPNTITPRLLQSFHAAVALYWQDNQYGDTGRSRAKYLDKLIQQITPQAQQITLVPAPQALTEETKKQVALLLCAIILLPHSTRLKEKVQLLLGLSQETVQALFEYYGITLKLCEALEVELVAYDSKKRVIILTTLMEQFSICPIPEGWDILKEKLHTTCRAATGPTSAALQAEKTLAACVLCELAKINDTTKRAAQIELLTLTLMLGLSADNKDLASAVKIALGNVTPRQLIQCANNADITSLQLKQKKDALLACLQTVRNRAPGETPSDAEMRRVPSPTP